MDSVDCRCKNATADARASAKLVETAIWPTTVAAMPPPVAVVMPALSTSRCRLSPVKTSCRLASGGSPSPLRLSIPAGSVSHPVAAAECSGDALLCLKGMGSLPEAKFHRPKSYTCTVNTVYNGHMVYAYRGKRIYIYTSSRHAPTEQTACI